LGRAPVKGGKKPKVTIVEYSEFQCPFCANDQATLKQIQKVYGDDVQIAFKHFPMPFHENAAEAALAAEAANEQGKFWQMHDKLFANQKALNRPALETYAKELKLDMVKFSRALDDGKFGAQVQADAQEAQHFGVRGTPSFFVNGTFVRGALPFEAFKVVIDEELKKANAKLASGVSHGDLYAVLTKDGLKQAASAMPKPPAPEQIQSSVPR
jgi:protein-disulfide isomerase